MYTRLGPLEPASQPLSVQNSPTNSDRAARLRHSQLDFEYAKPPHPRARQGRRTVAQGLVSLERQETEMTSFLAQLAVQAATIDESLSDDFEEMTGQKGDRHGSAKARCLVPGRASGDWAGPWPKSCRGWQRCDVRSASVRRLGWRTLNGSKLR